MAHISFDNRAPAYKGYLGRLRRRAPPPTKGTNGGATAVAGGGAPTEGTCAAPNCGKTEREDKASVAQAHG